jgi:hypothetical protein
MTPTKKAGSDCTHKAGDSDRIDASREHSRTAKADFNWHGWIALKLTHLFWPHVLTSPILAQFRPVLPMKLLNLTQPKCGFDSRCPLLVRRNQLAISPGEAQTGVNR